MEDLRQTALAYYTAATNEIQHVVEEVYKEMDPNDNAYVRFEEFSAYMKTVGCKRLSSEEFYDELKQCGNDKLFFDDIITLFYIIQSKRPFCGGKCKKFVKGMYFTCVKCLDDFDHDYDHDHDHEGSTFSVCAQCFADKNFEHRHEEFLDPIVLLHLTRMEALSKQTKYKQNTLEVHTASNSHFDKHGIATDNISNAIVPAVNQQSKQAKMQTMIQFGQLIASMGSIVVGSQLCTIM